MPGAKVWVGYDRRFLSKEGAHRAAEVLAGCSFRPMAVNRSSPARAHLVCGRCPLFF